MGAIGLRVNDNKKYREIYRSAVDITTGQPIITSLAHQPGAAK